MAFDHRVRLVGSEKQLLPDSQLVGDVNPNEIVRVTVVLHRTGGSTETGASMIPENLTPEQFVQKQGANPGDIATVEQFARASGLTVEESSARKRRVILTGTAEAMTKAFGARLRHYRVDTIGPTYRGREGDITIPKELESSVLAVIGMDNRPVAKPHIRTTAAAAASTSFTPPQVAALYSYPTGITGAGQTIGIIELGGGFLTADLTAYFAGLKIKVPTVTAVSVDGGANSPGSDDDGEVMLDIEVVGAIAPGANIAVYFAPNTDSGFVNAIIDGVHDTTHKPSVISISWGASEDAWTAQSRNAMNAALQDAAALGVTVTVASGDNGSTDGAKDKKLHVDFPSSSPFALACGGTTLKGSGSKITSEIVWNETGNGGGATGGGVSKHFARPAYQSSAGVPNNPTNNFVGRGVPDISGDADPQTGYQIRLNGATQVFGGTSAVAPLWAALVALLNQKLGKPVGFLNPTLYSMTKSTLHDITSGTNDDSGNGHYSAKSGWDPCTGLGTPNGTAILNALQTSTSAVSGR